MKKIIRNTLSLLICIFILSGCSTSSNGTAAYTEGTAGFDTIADYSIEDSEYAKAAVGENGEETETVSTEKLVYRGSVSLESKNYDETYSWIREQIESAGGMIADEYVYRSAYDSNGNATEQGCRSLSMTIRIPSEKFYSFLDDLDGNCHVTSRSTSIENITQSYNDVTVQIEALEKQETSLLNMMDQAETIEDMITVQDRLTEVQTELNQLKTERSAMDTDVAYSTLDLSLDEVGLYSGSSQESFGSKALDAINSGLQAFGDTMSSFLFGILYALPFLLLAAAVILVLYLILRKATQRRKPEKETKEKDHTIV